MIRCPIIWFCCTLFVLVLMGACQSTGKNEPSSEVVAMVFDNKLYLKDIPSDLFQNKEKVDSSALTNAYIEQWIRKMLLLHEAEKRKPESLDIDRLIENYKQSLLINNLERQVIAEELDTVVKANELQKIYETTREHYIQEFPIIRLTYIKIPEKAPQIDKFYDRWKKGEANRMKNYLEKYATTAILGEDTWWEWNEVQHRIDDEILSRYSFTKPRDIQKNIGEYEYFINIHEFVEKNEIAPLSFIEDQIRNIIIQKRKTTVMDDYLERLYEKEIKNQKIIVYDK